MNVFFKTFALIAVLMTAALPAANAQKVGHLDYGAVLEAMPDVKRANSEIEALQKQLAKQAENMQTKMQAKYADAMERAQAGTLTANEQKTIEAELAKMAEDLEKFAVKAEGDIAKKRDALLEPILTKIETAVKTVAKEKGLGYVMDITTLLYYEGGNDITASVKAKLGLP
jgi:outer membrane protein